MAWSAPVGEAWFLRVSLAFLALLAIVLLVHGWEALRRRLAAPTFAWLAPFGLACAALLALLVANLRTTPAAWDDAATAWLQGWAATPAGALLVFADRAVSYPVLAAAALATLAWPAFRRDWPNLYLAIGSAALAVGLVAGLAVGLPRVTPGPPGWTGILTAFPNVQAAILPSLLLMGRRLGVPRAILAVVGLLGAAACVGAGMSGHAHASDILAGLLLGLFIATGARAALHLQESSARPVEPALGRPLPLALYEGLDRLARRLMTPTTAVVLIAVGVLLRIVAALGQPLGVDAFVYAVMGQSFAESGTFTMPWGDAHTWSGTPAPSHHYPPLYPLLLAGAFKLFGFSQPTVHLAGLATGLLAILVAYLCARDLWGKGIALAATVGVALQPSLVLNTAQGYSENIVLILFTLLLWAFLKSIENRWWVVVAGALAGLSYLSKSSMGPFAAVALVVGVAWLVRWRGWRFLRDPVYWIGGAAAVLLAATWALRNRRLFGSFDTSWQIGEVSALALANPLDWASRLPITLLFFVLVGCGLYMGLLAWAPEMARLPRGRNQVDSALWLALALPVGLTALIDAALWVFEHHFYFFNIRYVSFVIVPAAWLVVRHVRRDERVVRVAALVSVATMLVGCAIYAAPVQSHSQHWADIVGARIEPGDTLGFVDYNNHLAYQKYFQVTANGTRVVPVTYACVLDPICPPGTPGPEGMNTTWVLTYGFAYERLPAGRYELVEQSLPDFNPDGRAGTSLFRKVGA